MLQRQAAPGNEAATRAADKEASGTEQHPASCDTEGVAPQQQLLVLLLLLLLELLAHADAAETPSPVAEELLNKRQVPREAARRVCAGPLVSAVAGTLLWGILEPEGRLGAPLTSFFLLCLEGHSIYWLLRMWPSPQAALGTPTGTPLSGVVPTAGTPLGGKTPVWCPGEV